MTAIDAVYKVQCVTYGIAKELMGIPRESNLALRCDLSRPLPGDALFRFRALPAYRSPAAQDLRRQVAQVVRERRHER